MYKKKSFFLPIIAGCFFLLIFGIWGLMPGAQFMWLPGGLFFSWFGFVGLCSLIFSPVIRRIMLCILVLLFIAIMILFFVVEFYIFSAMDGADVSEAQVGIIFGAGVDGNVPSLSLLARLEKGYEWWLQDRDRDLIVTGGQGDGEQVAEGQVMAAWLLEQGVPSSKIHVEDQARNTIENVEFSIPILESLHTHGVPVAVISNEFHLYRCETILEQYGYEGCGVPAETPYWYLKVTYCIREFFSVLRLWLMG